MAEKKTSQAQQGAPSFTSPFPAWQAMMATHLDRVEALYGASATFENQGLDQARRNVDEAARLTRASFDYTAQLMEQWRHLSLEATRQTFEAMTRPWTPNP